MPCDRARVVRLVPRTRGAAPTPHRAIVAVHHDVAAEVVADGDDGAVRATPHTVKPCAGEWWWQVMMQAVVEVVRHGVENVYVRRTLCAGRRVVCASS